MADDNPKPKVDTDDLPLAEQVDWDEMADEALDISADELEIVEGDGPEEAAEDVVGDDDDNPYQESDEALPDDDEERAIQEQNVREAGDPV